MSVLHDIRVILSLSCRESSRLLSDELDRTLSRTERIALRLHLVLCYRCRRFRRSLRVLRGVVRRMTQQCLSGEGPSAALTPDERARIAQAVSGAAGEDS